MSVELIREEDGTIPVDQLSDGQIADVVDHPRHRRRLVQRHGKNLICLGEEAGKSWSPCPGIAGFRVRVLPNGSKLEIINNESL